ncbi:KTSC domain-containing protein [Cohaesibacter celericrescens]|uniref:KTSC domain-containing protein n=1 Tax=Cohaesibacter celericrescens TaxID=2067669 RepID=A0A2N5XQ34_9HYPH|nr:KTSC domain-containing protein [Cohaesibacter celericrescens]PLW76631.1 KTSC domain-containing protein [Cohaesibacter celericrescens]
MEMTNVDSSNVAAIGFDESSQTLQVEFKNGTAYQYFDVPEAIYDGLLSAASVGQYLHQHVKGIYRYSRV